MLCVFVAIFLHLFRYCSALSLALKRVIEEATHDVHRVVTQVSDDDLAVFVQ